MDNKNERPALDEQTRAEKSERQGKDKNNILSTLTARQKNIYNLLCFRKCSAADISIELGYSDPRSHVARIIQKGIQVQSAWVNKSDTRYKIYWIEPDPAIHPNSLKVNKEDEVINEPHFKDLFDTRFNH
jgi:hypothetical protein